VRVATLKIEGVETVTVSLQRAVADIRLREGNRVTLEQIRRMVRANGFTPRDALVTAVGNPIGRGGAPAFELIGIDTVLLIDIKRSAPEVVAQLNAARAAGSTEPAEITGTVESKTDEPDPIVVTAFTQK
jgi:hypothetical protein